MAFLHAPAQVGVGRGQDANVRLHGLSAHGNDLLLLQGAQQPGLKPLRHVPDLVEEQAASLGELELPGPRRDPGRRPLGHAEHLRFEEVCRWRRS
jgi:hypothetical protein